MSVRLAANQGGKRDRAPRADEAPARQESRSPLFAALLVCYMLSGLTGLVYQVVWERHLSLLLGSTTAATGVVLAVFMGGLALGGALAGRVADRVARPLFAYGVLEAGIGGLALLATVVFSAALPIYRWVWQATGGAAGALLAVRFVIACLALLPPTTLMGATLPLLSRVYASHASPLGRQVGTLYSANLLGGTAGVMLTAFLLLPALGSAATTAVMASINFGLLCASLLIERSVPVASVGIQSAFETGLPPAERANEPPIAPAGKVGARGPNARPDRKRPDPAAETAPLVERGNVARVAILAFGVSGGVALVYEVAWTRALLLVIGSNVHAFAAMLATFLTGLFAGGVIASRLTARFRSPLVVMAWAQAMVGLCAWLSFVSFDSLPWLNLTLLRPSSLSTMASLLGRLQLSALILLPTAFALGTVFPVVVQACEPTLARIGRTVGDLYCANTVGAIFGALLASFVLIPGLGVQVTLRAAIAVNALLGLALFGIARRHDWLPRAVFAAIALAALWPTGWDTLLLAMAQPTRRAVARYREVYHQEPYASEADLRESTHREQSLLYSAEGAVSAVAVVRNQVNTVLLTNGHSDGSDNEDMPTQTLLAAIPLLLHPSPQDIAIVGWGTGVTAGVAGQFPVRRLTALEIEPAVVRASDFFAGVNFGFRRDPRCHIVLEDGRNYFLASRDQHDVIVSEPSNVWQAGVCNLFTRDFFALCRARLRAGGIFAQWIGYGSMPTAEVRGILAALHSVFPHILVFRVDEADAVVVGSTTPLRIDAARIQHTLASAPPALQAAMRPAKMVDTAELVARLAFGTGEIDRFCRTERPNTDDNARLEFAAAREYEQQNFAAAGGAAFDECRMADPLAYVDLNGLSVVARRAMEDRLQALRAANSVPGR